MRKLINRKGVTLMEIIVTLGIIGIIVIPLLNFFVLCGRILNIGRNEYEAVQTAQHYMEEIKAMDVIDSEIYSYDPESYTYERIVLQRQGKYGAEIKIVPDIHSVLHRIEIKVIDEGEIVNSLTGSVIFE